MCVVGMSNAFTYAVYYVGVMNDNLLSTKLEPQSMRMCLLVTLVDALPFGF